MRCDAMRCDAYVCCLIWSSPESNGRMAPDFTSSVEVEVEVGGWFPNITFLGVGSFCVPRGLPVLVVHHTVGIMVDSSSVFLVQTLALVCGRIQRMVQVCAISSRLWQCGNYPWFFASWGRYPLLLGGAVVDQTEGTWTMEIGSISLDILARVDGDSRVEYSDRTVAVISQSCCGSDS